MTARVVLVNPNRMQPAVAPIAVDYLASALAGGGFDVDLLDLCFTDDYVSDIEGYFARNEVSAVAVTIRNTDDACFATRGFFIPEYTEVIECLRACTPAPIILGGSGFSIMPEAILDHCGLELGVWGEGENALPELVARIAAREDFRDVPGLVYRGTEGFRRNPPGYIDLESRPAPHRAAVDNRRYHMEGGMGSIETKRGCGQRCIYCADALGKGTRVRCRSPRSVADEIEVQLEMGVDHLHLCDSEFNLPPQHAEAVSAEIVSRGLGSKLNWYTYCSPAPFTDEMAALFKAAGCTGINFGVDSASDHMLQILGRDFKAEDVARTAHICHLNGIACMFDLLLGAPGESRDSLRDTIETMKRISPSRVGAALGVRVYPGTRLEAMVRRQGPLKGNPNLHGDGTGPDETLLAPVFYLESALGEDVSRFLDGLIDGDERFFFMSGDDADTNYNYNDNTLLVDAIRRGYRGAFWDILRKLAEKAPP